MEFYLDKLIQGSHLDEGEAYRVMQDIMDGKINDCQIASFLTAIKIRGETAEEISGFSRAMLEKAVPVKSRYRNMVDTCGTGGDNLNTFNISTTSAFIAAGAGAVVAKHGNRSVSSRSGSADVLESLGVNIGLSCERVSQCIDTIGMGFIFAPVAHTAMKHVVRARKDMGIRTVFNILGPLTNPAMANGRVLGVYDRNLIGVMIEALKRLGVKRAYVLHSCNGMDELSTAGESYVSELKDGKIYSYVFNPSDLGFSGCRVEDLAGGDADDNANMVRGILSGRDMGPKRDSAVLNAAAAIIAAGKAEGFKDAVRLAGQSIDSGRALKKLEGLIEISNKLKA
ncbi:MAG: anthranilate phosphoribosyltransferase [Actinobacteria bacterium]|nr:anthranilate phosphoribosyltransferase [Actinomycetota bacterium]